MLRLVAAALAAVVLSVPAAFAEVDLCFAAQYDEAHFEKYPGQTPTSLRLRISQTEGDSYLTFEISATLRGKVGEWGEVGGCAPYKGKLRCAIDCDGGGLEIRPAKIAGAEEITLYNSRGLRIAEESCGEAEPQKIEARPGNRRFTLRKAELRDCE
jgi:hypothetical protein